MSTAIVARSLGTTRNKSGGLAGDWIAFLIPVSGIWVVSLGGLLPYAEVIFVLFLPLLVLSQRGRLLDKEYRTAYLLLGLWIFSQVLTDIFVDTVPINRAKGLARIVFFALDLVSIAAIIGTSLRRTKIFILGMIVNFVYSARAGGGELALQWKMLLGPPASMAVFLFASHLYVKRRYSAMLLLVALLAAANLHFASRSGMMIDLAAALLILPIFPKVTSIASSAARKQLWRVLILISLAVIAIWVSQQILKMAVNAGLFSEGDQAKYEQQSQGKLGIIFGGRPEGLVAMQAILDSPFLGHGSYAVDYKYYALLQEYRYKYGYAEGDETEDVEEPGIPTHSHLTMSWVEGGVLASFFWFYMLILIGKSIVRLTEKPHPLGPLYIFLLINLTWDILFSPFGLTRRMFEAFFLVIMINVLRSKPVSRERIDMRVGRNRPVVRRAQILRPVRSFRHG